MFWTEDDLNTVFVSCLWRKVIVSLQLLLTLSPPHTRVACCTVHNTHAIQNMSLFVKCEEKVMRAVSFNHMSLNPKPEERYFCNCTDKNKIKFSLYIRKFRVEQLQSHIWLTASSYMGKYLRISSYIRMPFLIYDFATAPFWISLYMRKILFSFLSVWSQFLQGLYGLTLDCRIGIGSDMNRPRTHRRLYAFLVLQYL